MNNYHTHTYRCRHASGDIRDYARAAAAAGLGELGISDHCPYPDGRWRESRMDMEDLPGYIEAIGEAKSAAAANPGLPRIIAGLECEWGPDIDSYIRDEFLGKHRFEYLVGGVHNFTHRGEWRDSYLISSPSELVSFAETSRRAMESGIFAYLAHPDVFCISWMPWDENARACATDILAAAEGTGTPLEINGYGFRKARVRAPEGLRRPYPHEEFWRMAAEYDIVCVVNSDAHRPVDTAAGLAEGREVASRWGLRVLDSLEELRKRSSARSKASDSPHKNEK